jgi:uncharacterized protein (TIRG00374 family)
MILCDDERRMPSAVAEQPPMSEVDETSEQPKASPIYWVLSLGIAAVLLYYSLRGVDWSGVWTSLKRADPVGISAALGIMSIALVLRAMRWRVLLSTECEISRPDVFWATAAGYLGNNFLPARAGELVRTVMISRRTGLTKTFVLTTALGERVVDALALITIGAVVLLMLPTNPGWLSEAAQPLAIAGIVGVLAISLFPLFQTLWERVLRALPIPARYRERAEHLLHHGLQGLKSFHNPRRLAKYLVYTAAIWFLDGSIVVVGAQAIGITIAYPIAFLLIVGLGLSSALPSTPGYVGIYQFVAVQVLTPFGFTQNDAIAFILLFQGMTYVVFLLWGSLGLWSNSRTPAAAITA